MEEFVTHGLHKETAARAGNSRWFGWMVGCVYVHDCQLKIEMKE